MQRAHGYVTIVEPDRPLQEIDTISCGHCQRVVFTKAGTAATVYLLPILPVTKETIGKYQEEPGAHCFVCMRPICLRCYQESQTATIPCKVWERRFEEAEARDRLRRSVP